MKASLSGLNAFVKKTKKQQAQIKQGAGSFVRNKVKVILKDLVLNTPQWSGNTAASWRVDLNYKPAVEGLTRLALDNWQEFSGEPSFKGEEEAWVAALAINQGHLAAIKYNSVIRIVNNAPYAEDLATRTEVDLKLRQGNYIPGDVMAIRTVAAKYKLGASTKTNLKDLI
jgi:hypothetical protein